VVETGCTYFSPLSFPGDVEVGIAVERLGNSSVTYRIGVFGAGSTEASAQGHFTHVYVGRESRRPAELPGEWRNKLERLS
jgi:acyl-CoA thioester hydrolase